MPFMETIKNIHSDNTCKETVVYAKDFKIKYFI